MSYKIEKMIEALGGCSFDGSCVRGDFARQHR